MAYSTQLQIQIWFDFLPIRRNKRIYMNTNTITTYLLYYTNDVLILFPFQYISMMNQIILIIIIFRDIDLLVCLPSCDRVHFPWIS